MQKSNSNITTIITEDCKLTGTLKFDTAIQINGKLKGKINAPEGYIAVEKNGDIEAEININKINNKGSIKGDINALEYIHIHNSSSVKGNIHTKELIIEKGGKLNGVCSMKYDEENIETNTEEQK